MVFVAAIAVVLVADKDFFVNLEVFDKIIKPVVGEGTDIDRVAFELAVDKVSAQGNYIVDQVVVICSMEYC